MTLPNDFNYNDEYGLVAIGSRESGLDRLAKMVASKVKSLFERADTDTVPSTFTSGMQFFKDSDSRLRFIATVTNNFRDREKELITEEAHREYIAWADAKSIYPELWLWHAGNKSRWGQADWLDYCDGFLIASGTVDNTPEALAIAANIKADEANIAVSHGFLATKADEKGLIHKYRMFELSPLPTWAAANEWTGFTFIDDGSIQAMPFSAEKSAWLKGKGATDDAIRGMEASLSTVAQSIQARGIEYKDLATFFDAKAQPDAITGSGSPSMGNPSGIHHPHTDQLTHYHYHIDGTYHEHGHTHNDGSVGHDTDCHSGMSGKSLVEHIKAVADAQALLGTKAVANANKSKPSEYADVPDDKFLDAANWKYPFDASHVKAAESYFNHEGQREAGGYSPEQWAAMGAKLASALGDGYSYADGKVVRASASKDLSDIRADIALLAKSVADLTMVVSKGTVQTLPPTNSSPLTPPVQVKSADELVTGDFVRFFNDEANRMNGGYQASSAPGTIVPKAISDAAQKEYDASNKDGWFERDVLGSLSGIMGAK